jgi:hypothetical protein
VRSLPFVIPNWVVFLTAIPTEVSWVEEDVLVLSSRCIPLGV